MTEDEAKRAVVAYWCEKAGQSLDSARAEHAAGRLSFAVNRCYYACFYAASAVFIGRGVRFVKHSGVRSAFHKELAQSGEISREQARLYDRLFSDRQEGDYVDFVEFSPAEVVVDIDAADKLVTRLRELANMY